MKTVSKYRVYVSMIASYLKFIFFELHPPSPLQGSNLAGGEDSLAADKVSVNWSSQTITLICSER